MFIYVKDQFIVSNLTNVDVSLPQNNIVLGLSNGSDFSALISSVLNCSVSFRLIFNRF